MVKGHFFFFSDEEPTHPEDKRQRRGSEGKIRDSPACKKTSTKSLTNSEDEFPTSVVETGSKPSSATAAKKRRPAMGGSRKKPHLEDKGRCPLEGEDEGKSEGGSGSPTKVTEREKQSSSRQQPLLQPTTQVTDPSSQCCGSAWIQGYRQSPRSARIRKLWSPGSGSSPF